MSIKKLILNHLLQSNIIFVIENIILYIMNSRERVRACIHACVRERTGESVFELEDTFNLDKCIN